MAMTVSVAMATFDGSAHVVEQLRSILQQSTPPAEIVVCDDRSSDGTAQLIAAFAQESPVPIRLFVNEERLGWRGNFMRAASLCESEVIAFCDQDDVWDRRKLQLVVREFEHPGTLMVFHDATIVGADLEPIAPFPQGAGEPDSAGPLERGPWRDVYGLTVAFRRELLTLWRHWPSSIDKSVGSQRAAHDQWVLFLATTLGRTTHLPQSLTAYRQHGRNAVGPKDVLARTSWMDAFLKHRDVIGLRRVVIDSRIRTLEEIVRGRDEYATPAAAALVVYETLRARTAVRAVVHDSSSPRRRLTAFATLLLRGAYSSDVRGLGRRTALDDGAAALLGPAGLDRLRRARSKQGPAGP